MAKQKIPTAPREATRLLISRAEAAKQIDDRVQLGQELLKRQIRAERDFDACDAEVESWNEYNVELLNRMFSAPEYGEEYASWSVISTLVDPSLAEKTVALAKEVKDKCRRLISTRERLTIIPEPVSATETTGVRAGARPSRKVFVVHGHDEVLKLEVARFVERLGLNAIILSEQANQGRTIIEKFEAHAEDAGFAIVLLTPDDIGAPVATPSVLKSRARQNVILELGYFIGKLTRSRVCALHKGDVELPSDILGVVYVSVAANWKLQLAVEMKTAWPDLDLNKAY
jgi:predicted nucleotide-binding protein